MRIDILKKSCVFCSDKKGLEENFLRSFPNFPREKCVFFETDEYLSTPDMHPISDDPYFLIIPRKHITSFRKADERDHGEIETHLRYLDQVFNPDGLKTRILFEHGQNADGNTTKSVYHAHLHVIYTCFEKDKILSRVMCELRKWDAAAMIEFDDFFMQPLKQILSFEDDYMMFCLCDANIYVRDTHGTFFSQFFRVILVDLFGERFINWKTASPSELKVFEERLNRLPMPPRF